MNHRPDLEFRADADPRLNARRGRETLIYASYGILCVTIFTILQYNLLVGPNRLPSQLIRFLLTCWLCASVYGGSKIAKTIAITLCSCGTIGFLLLLAIVEWSWLNSLSFIANAASYASYTYVLIFSKDVEAFLQQQRNRREQSRSN